MKRCGVGALTVATLMLAACGGASDGTTSRPVPSTGTSPNASTTSVAESPPTAPVTSAPIGTPASTESGATSTSEPVVLAYGRPVDLGVLPGGPRSWAGDINNAGQIAGMSYVGEFEHHAVWWPAVGADPIRLTDMVDLRHDQSSRAIEINDSGQILLIAEPRAFVVEPSTGSSTEIVAPFDEFDFDVADMNDHGQVVGTGVIERPPCDGCEADPITRAFVWDPETGETTIIGPLDGATSSGAQAINNQGHVAGWSDGRPFVWRPGDVAARKLDPLPGHAWATIYDLNDQGIAVGVSGRSAAMWHTDTGEVIDLGTLLPRTDHSWANSINQSGEVALCSHDGVWIADPSSGTRREVPETTFGWSVSINDTGHAVGTSNGRAALWNPTDV